MPTGWHLGVWIATFEAGVVLLINLIILLFCAVKIGGSVGVAQIFEGDCNTVGHITLGIHLVINVLSTLLLSASNYVMQSLSAPTRTEVDRAHEKGFWLDIGLQSMHNLKHTSNWKRLLWTLLSVSSIPLHLFYNSSFFSTTSANDYSYYIAQGPEMQDLPQNIGTFDWECANETLSSACSSVDASELSKWNNLTSSNCVKTYACSGPDIDPSNWEFLNPSDCLQAYAVDFLSDRRDIVVVTGDYTSNNNFLNFYNGSSGQMQGSGATPYDWICDLAPSIWPDINDFLFGGLPPIGFCSTGWRKINPSNWTIPVVFFPFEALNSTESLKPISESLEVMYCLSKTTASRCQLQFNLPLLAIVVAFNIVKVTCMAMVAIRMCDNPLVTLGDAVASFTNSPEPLTKDMCLASQSYLESIDKNQDTTSPLMAYQSEKTRWMTMASRRHWVMIGSLFLLVLSIILGFIGYAIHQLSSVYSLSGFSSLWQLGIGRTSSQNIITGWAIPTQGYGATVASVLLANLPQLIFSMIYLVFNSLCTKLFLALEWSSYAHSRKPSASLTLREISGPPTSSIYHSALSIFVVAVTFWDGDVVDTSNSVTSCGYSPVAMILTAIVGGSLILTSLAVGYFKHLQCDMPLAGSCSKAIAAACHPPEDGSDPLKPMKWGVVSKHPDSAIGHISFSSGEVSAPVPGCYYE
ncbi:hypothetical protein BDP27DRAFT_1429601 [Rhodocollybia butyracea]|uniref:DUF6536 domain-containing protein n=1 Tax=Rhodocollybia butyracea TaxID=206335 RepID=A0A9P5PDP9_9AGAR|nr:hypothetical protein BDP27DRAFT_1429601 [Rhodocollybia butyracea]